MGNKKGKFDGVKIDDLTIEKMTPAHALSLGGGFRCIRAEFVTIWKCGRIEREESACISRCWIVRRGADLVGYITLLADKLTLDQPMLREEGVEYQTFPAVKIGLLAGEERVKGVGRLLVEWALDYTSTNLSERLGIRFVTVDAFFDSDEGYDASGFYKTLGFRYVNPDEPLPVKESFRSMYFDIGPLAPTQGFRKFSRQSDTDNISSVPEV